MNNRKLFLSILVAAVWFTLITALRWQEQDVGAALAFASVNGAAPAGNQGLAVLAVHGTAIIVLIGIWLSFNKRTPDAP